MNANFCIGIEAGFTSGLDKRSNIGRFRQTGIGRPLGQIDGIPNPDTAG